MVLSRDALAENGIYFKENPYDCVGGMPPHVSALRRSLLDFDGTLPKRFGLSTDAALIRFHLGNSEDRQFHENERREIDAELKARKETRLEADYLKMGQHREAEWQKFYGKHFFDPLVNEVKAKDGDSRRTARNKFYYDHFYIALNRPWTLFYKGNSSFRQTNGLTQPIPDWVAFYPIYRFSPGVHEMEAHTKWVWTNSLRDNIIENFSIRTLRFLVKEGLESSTNAAVLRETREDKVVLSDCICFPWLIVEHKHHDRNTLQVYTQAANAASAAVSMLQNLSQFATRKDRDQHVPPVVTITTVDNIVRVWIVYSRNGHAEFQMDCIWIGDVTTIMDAIKLQAILENTHTWAMRVQRPWISSYIDKWKSEYNFVPEAEDDDSQPPDEVADSIDPSIGAPTPSTASLYDASQAELNTGRETPFVGRSEADSPFLATPRTPRASTEATSPPTPTPYTPTRSRPAMSPSMRGGPSNSTGKLPQMTAAQVQAQDARFIRGFSEPPESSTAKRPELPHQAHTLPTIVEPTVATASTRLPAVQTPNNLNKAVSSENLRRPFDTAPPAMRPRALSNSTTKPFSGAVFSGATFDFTPPRQSLTLQRQAGPSHSRGFSASFIEKLKSLEAKGSTTSQPRGADVISAAPGSSKDIDSGNVVGSGDNTNVQDGMGGIIVGDGGEASENGADEDTDHGDFAVGITVEGPDWRSDDDPEDGDYEDSDREDDTEGFPSDDYSSQASTNDAEWESYDDSEGEDVEHSQDDESDMVGPGDLAPEISVNGPDWREDDDPEDEDYEYSGQESDSGDDDYPGDSVSEYTDGGDGR